MISIVVTALNEEKNLRAAVEKILKSTQAEGISNFEIIIVNDGSTDETSRVVGELEQQYPFVRSIHHPFNQGMGKSFLDAVQIANCDKVTIVPGDDFLSARMIREALRHAGQADMAIGFYHNTEERDTSRYVIHLIYCLLFVFSFRVHLRDIHGLPVYSVKKLRDLKLYSTRYGLFAEINVKLLRMGCSYVEFGSFINRSTLAKKSVALRPQAVLEAVWAYFRLLLEVYFTERSTYAFKPNRIIPQDVLTELGNDADRHHIMRGKSFAASTLDSRKSPS